MTLYQGEGREDAGGEGESWMGVWAGTKRRSVLGGAGIRVEGRWRAFFSRCI